MTIKIRQSTLRLGKRSEVNTLPNIYPTDVLTNTQIAFLSGKLPEPQAETGRPAYTNRELLPGILRILRSGCRWRDLDLPGYPSGITHWRRLRYWMRNGALRSLFAVLCKLHTRGQNLKNLTRISLDATLIPSFAFADTTGYSGNHKRNGVKLSTLVDTSGVPYALQFAAGNVSDIRLAETTLRSLPIRPTILPSPVLLADRGYDSFLFRRFLRDRGIDPNIKRRRNTREKRFFPSHYRFDPPLERKRFVVERYHAWMKSNRRVRMRYDYSLKSFQAFVYLSAIVLCVRQLVA